MFYYGWFIRMDDKLLPGIFTLTVSSRQSSLSRERLIVNNVYTFNILSEKINEMLYNANRSLPL
ncbi:MAG: hypothetical protein AMXMBFR50_26780 [Ignavibacterium album]